MSVQATEATTAPPPGMYVPATSGASAGSADKEMFLQLLVAQLRYQDPMNPADSSEFLSQSATFTSLEKMQDVADQSAAMLNAQVAFGASNLVGRQVTYLNADGESVSGTVGAVTYGATGPSLLVGEDLITLAQIQSVNAGPGTPVIPGTPVPSATTPSTGGTTDPADPGPSVPTTPENPRRPFLS